MEMYNNEEERGTKIIDRMNMVISAVAVYFTASIVLAGSRGFGSRQWSDIIIGLLIFYVCGYVLIFL
jgi:hypothetical protein